MSIPETRRYPPLAEPPDPDNATQLNILRKRVSEYWVDGLLEHSLYNEVLISLRTLLIGFIRISNKFNNFLISQGIYIIGRLPGFFSMSKTI